MNQSELGSTNSHWCTQALPSCQHILTSRSPIYSNLPMNDERRPLALPHLVTTHTSQHHQLHSCSNTTTLLHTSTRHILQSGMTSQRATALYCRTHVVPCGFFCGNAGVYYHTNSISSAVKLVRLPFTKQGSAVA